MLFQTRQGFLKVSFLITFKPVSLKDIYFYLKVDMEKVVFTLIWQKFQLSLAAKQKSLNSDPFSVNGLSSHETPGSNLVSHFCTDPFAFKNIC
jgi:hypothetical protein